MIADKVHEFNRGASFEAVMGLPVNVEPGYFTGWTPVCQLREYGKPASDSLIADIDFKWIVDEPNKFILSSNDTDNWPLCFAELDVLFVSPTGRRIRTKKLVIRIQDGVSKD